MDYNNISAHLMLDLLRHTENSSLIDSKYSFFSFDGPMNLTWFDVWTEQLKKRGVEILLNHRITELHRSGNVLTHLEAVNTVSRKATIIRADTYVNALSVESLAKLNLRPSFRHLSQLGHQIQTQVLYYIPYRMNEVKPTVYIFHESPWFLMTRHEGSLWDTIDCDFLSCGIGMWDVPGLNGKTALECRSREELAEECWNQMIQFKPENFPVLLPEWNIWKSFNFKLVDTSEPKFSNNVGTLELRPHAHDELYKNLYHATSYTRTNTNIFNMESGVEAGIRVANLLGCEKRVNEVQIDSYFTRFIRWIDSLVFKLQRFCCRI